MKQVCLFLLTALVLNACKNTHSNIVNNSYIDSLLQHNDNPATVKANQADMLFWKNKIQPGTPDYTNTLKYAATCINAFHYNGDFDKVLEADSILNKTARDFNGKEAAPYMAMVQHCILEHRFNDADSFFTIAQQIGIKKYDSCATAFDLFFERGQIELAKHNLAAIAKPHDYGYQFRMSKLMHYYGNLDSSIKAMQAAVDNAATSPGLQMAALSNLGDLYIHAGELSKANNCYMQCLDNNTADWHSLMGIGWIALMADHNDSLAEHIFQYVSTKTQSPEPLLKLISVAEYRNDTAMQYQYAKAFEQAATQRMYGNMYNKYMIQLYTGILHQPKQAEAMAERELFNRATPQTYAWYAWALLNNGKDEKAYEIYNTNVSGKPLEALELYYMGKLMQHFNKGYNAHNYFKAAFENKFDLSHVIQKDLNRELEQ
ncbi:MAG: hypothetical protein JST86_14000 [Bacteroidetes bacterium]|nr:hypothetical protein [Bacteroidota bacterium]